MAPLTRNRASPSEKLERTWVPNSLYVLSLLARPTRAGPDAQQPTACFSTTRSGRQTADSSSLKRRASSRLARAPALDDCALTHSDRRPVSVEASGMPGVPGTFTDEQLKAWKPITAAVRANGGVFFAQRAFSSPSLEPRQSRLRTCR